MQRENSRRLGDELQNYWITRQKKYIKVSTEKRVEENLGRRDAEGLKRL